MPKVFERAWLSGRDHGCRRRGAGLEADAQGSVRAADASPGRSSSGFWRGDDSARRRRTQGRSVRDDVAVFGSNLPASVFAGIRAHPRNRFLLIDHERKEIRKKLRQIAGAVRIGDR